MDWRRDGMSDLAKQGFMKPRKKRMRTFYSVWIDDKDFGRCVVCKTKDKHTADSRCRSESGFITTTLELD